MKIAVIGAGFGGMSAAAYMAKAGHEVHVYEKNDEPGGRATTFVRDGFSFDVGPTWYLMPDVYEEFFADFGHTPADYYQLTQLVPGYRVYDTQGHMDVRPASAAYKDFEDVETGAGARLGKYMDETRAEYKMVRDELLMTDGLSYRQYLNGTAMHFLGNPNMLQGLEKRVAKVVKDDRLRHILEFMTVFMGGSPRNIPALYALLAWVDLGLGVWYPEGGFGRVARGFEAVAKEQGVTFHYGAEVQSLRRVDGGMVIVAGDTEVSYDRVVANADYQYVETQLLAGPDRAYDASYWKSKTLAPSAILGMVGVSRRVDIPHHALFFDTDWDEGFANVFERGVVGDRPLFYVCAPSVTDRSTVPVDGETMVLLIPVAAGIELSTDECQSILDAAIARIVDNIGDDFRSDMVVCDALGPDYFSERFHASGGTAFGLAHTLRQSGPLRPRIRSSVAPELYYVGQYTNPGTGVPLVVLGGKLVAGRLQSDIS